MSLLHNKWKAHWPPSMQEKNPEASLYYPDFHFLFYGKKIENLQILTLWGNMTGLLDFTAAPGSWDHFLKQDCFRSCKIHLMYFIHSIILIKILLRLMCWYHFVEEETEAQRHYLFEIVDWLDNKAAVEPRLAWLLHSACSGAISPLWVHLRITNSDCSSSRAGLRLLCPRTLSILKNCGEFQRAFSIGYVYLDLNHVGD